jgi:hypothetical protein
VPEIVGAAVFDGATGAGGGGGAVTGPTLALVADADPPSFVAVTVTDTFLPTSALDNVCDCPVAPSDHL